MMTDFHESPTCEGWWWDCRTDRMLYFHQRGKHLCYKDANFEWRLAWKQKDRWCGPWEPPVKK